MITINITRRPSTDEYRVGWRDGNGRDIEAKAYYTDDPKDAVETLMSTVEEAQQHGEEVQVSSAQQTVNLINRYHPTYLRAPEIMRRTVGIYEFKRTPGRARGIFTAEEDIITWAKGDKKLRFKIVGKVNSLPEDAQILGKDIHEDHLEELYQSDNKFYRYAGGGRGFYWVQELELQNR